MAKKIGLFLLVFVALSALVFSVLPILTVTPLREGDVQEIMPVNHFDKESWSIGYVVMTYSPNSGVTNAGRIIPRGRFHMMYEPIMGGFFAEYQDFLGHHEFTFRYGFQGYFYKPEIKNTARFIVLQLCLIVCSILITLLWRSRKRRLA